MIFVPKSAPEAKIAQLLVYGSTVLLVDGTYGDAFELCLESAEILEHFQGRETATDSNALAGELADVALYLLQLASITEIDLEQAIMDKLALNYDRTWPAQ